MNQPAIIKDIYLAPGEFYFGSASTRIRTVLGSCIAIIMWHPIRLLGGMAHFVLPSRGRCHREPDGKYADESMELFQQHARMHGTSLSEYQIKLFGGGNMFPQHLTAAANVAAKNIVAIENLIEKYQLTTICKDLGKSGSRSVLFEVWSGYVWVRHQPLMRSAAT